MFSAIFKQTVKGTRRHFSSNKGKVIAIEGNIGAGKTVLLNYLKGRHDVDVQEEPVNNWRNVDGVNALSLLYSDPKRWSFMFNQYAMLSRLKIYQQPCKSPIKIIERSVFSTFHIFIQNNFNNKDLNAIEYKVLHDWFQFLVSSLNINIDHYVYLRTEPEICLERVRKRGRMEEESLSLAFLMNIHDLHEDLFTRDDHHHKLHGSQVHVIDATPDINQLYPLYDSIMSNSFKQHGA